MVFFTIYLKLVNVWVRNNRGSNRSLTYALSFPHSILLSLVLSEKFLYIRPRNAIASIHVSTEIHRIYRISAGVGEERMQLTTLELKGFKSFGDKVTIHFDRGITGIVGPNGCGKSNVVDAIRWVLGEQKTRMLRSDKMENIIFNGTKKRKPTQLAEVSLTFDNTRNLLPTEYTQVTVTRRYFRSGDSEYQLNGVTCRLKDIVNLFMDTGIASNSYAIIELKMVDDLLNDKDNSRRHLFEEAAGISKFRVRKKETLRKLDATDADLDRVDDLLFEIEKNLRSLEKQARQAERYYKTQEVYKGLSVRLSKATVQSQREALDRINVQLAQETDRKVSLTRQLAEQEAALEQRKTGLIKQEKLLSSRQKTLNEHVERVRTYESDKQVKNERLRLLQEQNQRLTDQLQQDRASIDQTTTRLDELRSQNTQVAEQLEASRGRVATLEKEYQTYQERTQVLKGEATVANQTFRQQQDEVYQLRKDLEVKQMQRNVSRQEMEKSAADSEARSADLSKFDAQAASLATQLEERQETLRATEQEQELWQQQVDQLTQEAEATKEALVQLNRAQDATQNEYNLTKSLVDNLEGFPEAIKFLKKNVDWAKNAPLLSDVVTCPEEYRVSIENFLSPYMNYYVVQTAGEAWQAIRLLSDASKGKAHFFVLDRFADFTPAPIEQLDHSVAAVAVAEYDRTYAKLIEFLLNDTYITGPQFALPADSQHTFITQDGRVIQRPSSLSGGSVGLFEGKRIGRAKNLENLKYTLKERQSAIEAHQERLREQQQQLQTLKQNALSDTIFELQREINRINQEYVTYRSRQEQLAEVLNSSHLKREDTLSLMQELEEACADLAPRVAAGEQDLADYEARTHELNADLATENDLFSEKSAAYNQAKISFFQLENQQASVEQEIDYKEEAYQTAVQRIGKNQEELVEAERAITTLLESNEVGEDELLSLYEEKETLEAGVNEAEKDYYQARGDIEQVEKTIREIQRQREQCDTLIMAAQTQLNETKLALSSVKERLSVEFEVNLDDLLKEATDEEEDVDLDELRAQLEKVRDKLQRMGPINPMAMEAYDEIKERHDFIAREKDDLVNAKEALLVTIDEIDTVAKETFMEAFERIKENFVKVFRSLFTDEDKCDLRLAEPDNPLESAIEIIAQPKGKRPLTINQLSGGEKTLTATSLLFAIYLLKPAPFCIFDEVDAPLDDANIDKFNNIIRDFSGDSQFIIVTHNKRTMASTDIIYGVTMIEQGVSRVVPVDLRELEV